MLFYRIKLVLSNIRDFDFQLVKTYLGFEPSYYTTGLILDFIRFLYIVGTNCCCFDLFEVQLPYFIFS